MLLASVLVFNAFVGALLATVVLRADLRRRENQTLALACLLDAAVTGTMGIAVALGSDVASPAVVHLCNVGRILIVHPILEFTYAFPFDRRPPRAVRAAGLAASGAALFLDLYPPTVAWFSLWSAFVFFIPYFAVTATVLLRNVWRMRRRGNAAGAVTIAAALAFRWGAEVTTYLVVRPLFPRAFAAAFTFDATAAVFIGYVAIAYAVLRYRFFRVRGLIAEASLYGLLALCALAIVGVGTDVVLEHVHSPLGARIALTTIALFPLAAWLLFRQYFPRIEDAFLAPFDPMRTLRRSLLGRVLRETSTLVEPEAVVRTTCEALGSLCGGRAVFLATLPPALADHFERTKAPALHRFEEPLLPPAEGAALRDLGADLVVAATFEGKAYGAIAVHGGQVDQDTIAVSAALASHLASKLAHHALYRRAFDLQRQLEEANRLATLGAFAAAIAHDIRTPLTSVQLNVQMLRASPGLSSKDAEHVAIALEELKRMARYVSEILEYSKPVQLQPVEIEVPQLLEEAARGMERYMESRRLKLGWSPPSGDLPAIRADPARLRQVLENLVQNAADASPAGGEIQLRARSVASGRVAIEVTDFGRGIAPNDLARIFEPFFTTRSDGTGLGLAIVKKLVDAHDGEITVRSEPGAGSTFIVVLPA